MAERLSPAARARVVSFANTHGPRAAAGKFGVPLGTVKGWQHRARRPRRRTRPQPPAPAAATAQGPTPAEQFTDRAQQLAAWAARGACLQCGGAGIVQVPATMRGSLLIRRARRVPCPTCGGAPRIVRVTEWPRDEWVKAMALAGDAGFGWDEREWAMIRGGESNPDGHRFTGRDTPGGGR
jgi:hypothetical protein